MRTEIGVSSLLAAAASLLMVGMLAVGTPALAQSEEDLAAPQGAFVSTMAAPKAPVVYRVAVSDSGPLVTVSEEDLAVPPGAFTSAMTAPEFDNGKIRLAANEAADLGAPSLAEIVAASLE